MAAAAAVEATTGERGADQAAGEEGRGEGGAVAGAITVSIRSTNNERSSVVTRTPGTATATFQKAKAAQQ